MSCSASDTQTHMTLGGCLGELGFLVIWPPAAGEHEYQPEALHDMDWNSSNAASPANQYAKEIAHQ